MSDAERRLSKRATKGQPPTRFGFGLPGPSSGFVPTGVVQHSPLLPHRSQSEINVHAQGFDLHSNSGFDTRSDVWTNTNHDLNNHEGNVNQELHNQTMQNATSNHTMINHSTPKPAESLRSVYASASNRSHRSIRSQQLAAEKLQSETEYQRKMFEIEMKKLELERKMTEAEQREKRKYFDEIASENGSVVESIPCSRKKVDDWLKTHQQQNPFIPTNGRSNTPVVFQNMQNSIPVPLHSTRSLQHIPTHNNHHSENRNVSQNDVLLAAFNALRESKIKDLPIFNGDNILEFPNFLSEFERSTQESNINSGVNLRRLNKALQGQARVTVQSLLNDPENVSQIIELLKMNFGRKEWIIVKLLNKLKSFPVMREENVDNFRKFYNEIFGVISAIKNMNAIFYMQSPDLLWGLEEKLPLSSKNYWNHYKADLIRRNMDVGLMEFSEWFKGELDAQYAGLSMKDLMKKSDVPRKPAVVNVVQDNSKPKFERKFDKKIFCTFCDSKTDHNITKCKKFYEKTVEERRLFASQKRLCYSCLRRGHGSDVCNEKDKYKCTKCSSFHNDLLHQDKQETVTCINTSDVILRFGKIQVKGPNGVQTIDVFFDDGSTASLIDESAAKNLGLSGPQSTMTYKWVKDVVRTEESSSIVEFEVAPMSSDKFHKLINVRTVKNLSLPHQRLNVEEIMNLHPYVDRKLLEKVQDMKPVLLIGTNNGGLTVPLKTIQNRINGLQICKSRLGWTIHGPIYHKADTEDFTMAIHVCYTEDDDKKVSDLLLKSYEIDNFGITDEKSKLSDEDSMAINIMKTTLKKVEDRYEIGHLYRYSNIKFPTIESKNMALRRLTFIERKMDADINFANAYQDKINDYLSKRYARKLTPEECEDTSNTFYLPHFGVYNPNKPGKFRMVMDAKAKAGHFSLNDLLLKGPDFVPSLTSVIWRGRINKYFVSADIREMFHQVRIRAEDQNSQRFLFRGMNRTDPPDVYVMEAMIFGAVSSPSVAQFVKNENAKLLESEYPGISDAILLQHYVDDYFDCFHSEEEAIRMVKNVITAHKQGGFELVKWFSNSPAVMQSISQDMLLPEHNTIDIIRILGLILNVKTDRFEFDLKFEKFDQELVSGRKTPSKREFLAFMMSIFDPIGFLNPLMVKLRIIFQEVWREGTKWDEKISITTFKQWQEWLKEAASISKVEVPRCYVSIEYKSVQLHTFVDASDKAYAAVVYLRVQEGDQVHVSLVQSKARVAPLKHMTIPRLELQAAVVGSCLAKTVTKELNINIDEHFFWSDSKIVLSWIETKEKLNAYVGSRITKINDCTNKRDWHWIPSNLNPADLATKLSNKADFNLSSKWFVGPSFLIESMENWPIDKSPSLNEEEHLMFMTELHQKIHIISVVDTPQLDILNADHYSHYIRMIRSTAFVIKMTSTLKLSKNERPKKLFINLSNLHEAKELWYKKVQKDCYSQEIHELKSKGYVKKSSHIYPFSPYLDDKGIIRMKGRIPGYNPIILHPKHKFTFLLAHWYHEINLHMGVDAVINQLREQFWIPRGRALVKKVFNDCMECRVRNPKVKSVIMGDIPPERSEPSQYPFMYVGLDYFGPMMVKYGRRYEKIWGALFTCMSSRAIHVELVSKLDTNSALMAIMRFANLRGCPKKIFSDNATCFKGASNELIKLNNDHIRDKLTIRNIDWVFNPPASPNFGGVYERMVRSVKNGLKVLIHKEIPSYEVLSTAVSEIVNTINNRPLTYVSSNPDDFRAITPNDILLLRENTTQFDEEIHNNFSPRQTWKKAHEMADKFWRDWVKSYRPNLLKRNKWHDNRDDPKLQVGDYVEIIDENQIRGRYLHGIIVKTFPDKNDLVRVVNVKTKDGILQRCVSKIAKIDLSVGAENVIE